LPLSAPPANAEGRPAVLSGTFSTAAGPHAGGPDVRRLGNLLDATYVHVRVATAFVVIAAGLLLVLQYGSWRPNDSKLRFVENHDQFRIMHFAPSRRRPAGVPCSPMSPSPPRSGLPVSLATASLHGAPSA
jgi:hypothetical protein